MQRTTCDFLPGPTHSVFHPRAPQADGSAGHPQPNPATWRPTPPIPTSGRSPHLDEVAGETQQVASYPLQTKGRTRDVPLLGLDA